MAEKKKSIKLKVGTKYRMKFDTSKPTWDGINQFSKAREWLFPIMEYQVDVGEGTGEYVKSAMFAPEILKDKLLAIPIQMGDEVVIATMKGGDNEIFWDIGLFENDKVVQTLSTKVKTETKEKAKLKSETPPEQEMSQADRLQQGVSDEVGAIFRGCCKAFGLDPDQETLPDGIFRVVNTVIMRKMK